MHNYPKPIHYYTILRKKIVNIELEMYCDLMSVGTEVQLQCGKKHNIKQLESNNEAVLNEK